MKKRLIFFFGKHMKADNAFYSHQHCVTTAILSFFQTRDLTIWVSLYTMQFYGREKKKRIGSWVHFSFSICETEKKLQEVQWLILKDARKISGFNYSRIPSEQTPQFRSGLSKHCCPKIFKVLLKSFKKKCGGTSWQRDWVSQAVKSM